MKHKKMQR
jgi:hypothetical protein